MVDMVVHRRDLRETIARLLELLRHKAPPAEVVTLPGAEAGPEPVELPESPGDGAK
jgi:acetyl-CoA carboxylase carboxyl transferase subunit beta